MDQKCRPDRGNYDLDKTLFIFMVLLMSSSPVKIVIVESGFLLGLIGVCRLGACGSHDFASWQSMQMEQQHLFLSRKC